MKLTTALQLGRVSNLPTVWSNVLAGVGLAGTATVDFRLLLLVVSMSLFYTGGMFLNDAFDHGFDAKVWPGRPIPSGQVSAAQVYAFGIGMMVVGFVLLAWVGYRFEPLTQWRPVAAGLALAGAILFYNWHHKNNPLSPLLMGVCRMLVYITAALAVLAVVPAQVIYAAVILLCYLIGLTYAAKKEHLGRLENIWPLAFLAVPLIYGIYLALSQPMVVLPLAALTAWVIYALSLLRRRKPGDVPRAVVSLIAGISILDAMLLTSAGAVMLAWFSIAAFGATLTLQRWVSGT